LAPFFGWNQQLIFCQENIIRTRKLLEKRPHMYVSRKFWPSQAKISDI
jgi:hypothetical protein